MKERQRLRKCQRDSSSRAGLSIVKLCVSNCQCTRYIHICGLHNAGHKVFRSWSPSMVIPTHFGPDGGHTHMGPALWSRKQIKFYQKFIPKFNQSLPKRFVQSLTNIYLKNLFKKFLPSLIESQSKNLVKGLQTNLSQNEKLWERTFPKKIREHAVRN